MNRQARLIFGSAAALLLTNVVSADDRHADYRSWFGLSIVGSWEVEVTVRQNAVDCPNSTPVGGVNPFPALNTFHEGGTISETGSRSPPSRRSPGHGIWQRTGRNSYAARVRFQSFDANGFLSNNMDRTTNITLSPDGMSFSAISRFRFSDLSGNALLSCATMEGVRITL